MFDSLHILFVKATSVVVAFFLFLGISVTQPSQHVRVPEKQNAPQQIKTATENPAPALDTTTMSPPTQEATVEPDKIIPARQNQDTVIISSGDVAIQMPTPQKIQAPTLLSTSFLNEKARAATVNIFCLTKTGGILDPISGSGVIIHEKGVIITSAHIAQYFLLKDYLTKNFIDCTIRIGSPAAPAYKAELLYMPPIWIESNAEKIVSDAPMGTGEYDFALLYITAPVSTGNTQPNTFPFIEPADENDELVEGSSVFLSGYSAGFIDNLSVLKNLWLATSIATLKNVFVFHDSGKNPELLALSGTTAAQEGASGGAVIDFVNGKLHGLIAARTDGDTTGERELRAISMWHVNDTLKNFAGKTLVELISGNVAAEGRYFNAFVAPRLTKILTDVLDK